MFHYIKYYMNIIRRMSTVSIPKTQKALVLHAIDQTGDDYSVIKYEDIEVPKINEDEILIKNAYTGINFIEKYFRIGLYPSQKPYVLGREASGVVVQTGAKVSDYKVGDYVAYGSGSTFAQFTKFKPHVRIMKLPNGEDQTLQTYAGAIIQALTALTFITEAYNVQKGDYILVHAAAGGVGLILTQLIKDRGAHVIATASTPEKLELAKKNGAEFTICSKTEDIVARVLEITGGKGVQASFDSVGKDTFKISMDSLARKGTYVSFGNASGPVPPLSISTLTAKNIKVLRPTVFNYIETPEEWEFYSKQLTELIESKKLKIDITKVYDMKDYPIAAADLENRRTTGKLLLRVPQ